MPRVISGHVQPCIPFELLHPFELATHKPVGPIRLVSVCSMPFWTASVRLKPGNANLAVPHAC